MDITGRAADLIRERVESKTFVIYCQQGCGVERFYDGETFELLGRTWPSDRRGTRREATLGWEYEYGDFGAKLASWPVFELSPPCPGPEVYEFGEERNPDRCPLSENYGDTNPMVDEILAASRERRAFRHLLEGGGRKLKE